jgi:hypothetical protein
MSPQPSLDTRQEEAFITVVFFAFAGINVDMLQIAWAKQAEPSLFLFNPAIHAGASDVTPHRTC